MRANISRHEVWHDLDNRRLFDKLAAGKCPGVPFFFNLRTNAFVCGAEPCDELKAKLL